METKELKIEVPEGYEIDKENSSFELIKFKKKEYKFPTTWEDYKVSLAGTQYYCSTGSNYNSYATYTHSKNINEVQACVFEADNKEDVIAFRAFARLLQLRNAWWRVDNNWKPDWRASNTTKYCIEVVGTVVKIDLHTTITQVLAFRTPEIRDNFYSCFKDLIEEAKDLI